MLFIHLFSLHKFSGSVQAIASERDKLIVQRTNFPKVSLLHPLSSSECAIVKYNLTIPPFLHLGSGNPPEETKLLKR